jgi:hypothetical protein
LPLASGTVQLDTTIGRFSIETSANQIICRASLHSLRIDFVDDHQDVARLAFLVLGELGDRHLEHRECGVGADPAVEIELAQHRRAQVVGRRLGRALQQLLAVDDLDHAALVGAVAEIDPVALRARRDRPVQVGRHLAGRARLLADQAEVADVHRLGRIGEVVDLGHALGAPVLGAADQKGDAGVAFPPVLVGVAQALEAGQQLGIGRIGDVPDLMRLAAEGAQHVDRALVALGQRAPSHSRTICAPPSSYLPARRDVAQVFRVRGIGDVDDRGAVGLGLPVIGLTGVGMSSVPP